MTIKLTKPHFNNKEYNLLKKTLNSGWVTEGKKVQLFEKKFCDFQKVNYSLAINSCTSALLTSLKVLGIQRGDEVIVPAFGWPTTANVIEFVGAKAIFVDVDRNNFNIDTRQIEEKISKKTRAIIIVHLFGLTSNINKILKITKKYNLKLIEDAACAIGSKYKNKFAGNFGDLSCFSFHPRKLITTGEGGMLSFNDRKFYNSARGLINHGMQKLTKIPSEGIGPWTFADFSFPGINMKMSDIAGALGVVQFAKLTSIIKKRISQAQFYINLLSKNKFLKLPAFNEKVLKGHTYQSFVVLIKDGNRTTRNNLMKNLLKKGIESRPGTISIPHTQYYSTKYLFTKNNFPQSIFCENSSITLPLFHNLKRKQQLMIVNQINSFFNI
ncbi:MAG: glutamine--scyllo-inositol aminotransferase [Proteobacteria bacterium]|nr:glutamine--scyllo-inositol aminotransferase [Pseudomonadota bacterium]